MCPNCDSMQSIVVNSRKQLHRIYRRRVCKYCDCKFTTLELVAIDHPLQVLRDK
jgi:transcriptional regulator NrdR family protein